MGKLKFLSFRDLNLFKSQLPALFGNFSANDSRKMLCFEIPKDLLLMMGTGILRIDASLAKKS